MGLKKISWLLVPIVLFAAVCVLFRAVLFVGVVPSASMEPTIPAGSVLLGCRVVGELRQGDVILFEHDGKILVKRIAAVSEDRVFLNDETGSFSVNRPFPESTRTLTVPEGCFFVVGDNRENSLDSRVWQKPFVDKENVIAVLLGSMGGSKQQFS